MADTNQQTAMNTPQLSRVNSKNDGPSTSLGVKKPLETASNADTATIADRNSADVEKKIGASEKVEPVDESRYVTGQKLFLILIAFVTSIFLVALDQTIVATAIPAIVSKWNVLTKVSWIATAYFLTQAGCMLTAGQLLTIVPTKWVYLVSIVIFEIGSLFCGVAWNINFLIFGRAFAGVGAAAIFISVLSIIAEVTKLETRPLIFGAIGSVFALASVVGPLLGGVFADKVSWRWCFYINLPFGVIAVGGVLFFLEARPVPPQPQYAGMTTARKWLTVDWIGSVICLGMVTSLLLPLQWGGNERPWSDPAVIALLCVFGVTLIMFIAWQYRIGPKAIMPLFMFKRSTQVGACLEAFFVMLGLLVGIYYLPFFYQAKGSSATQSGIDILPFMLSVVIMSGVSGGVINQTGRYWPWLVGSPLFMSVGAGLLYTIDANTSTAKLVGYQIIFGAGIGGALQNAIIAIQAEYAHEEAMVPQATSLVTFLQLIGGLIGLAISGSIFGNQLQTQLAFYAPDIAPETAHMVRQSVQAVFTLPPEVQKPVIDAYIRALDYVFIIAVPAGAFATGSAFLIKNYSLKERGAGAGMAL